MDYILFDDNSFGALKPLTLTRPVCEIRLGILTIREKWEKYLKANTLTQCEDYLNKQYPMALSSDMMMVNSSLCPDKDLLGSVLALEKGQKLTSNGEILAKRVSEDNYLKDEELTEITYHKPYTKVRQLADIFLLNDKQIREDFALLTKGRKSQTLSPTNRVLGEDIFVEQGASVEFATLNATTGPIYIGKDAVIMENACVRGPLALCEGAVVRMAAKIYEATTIGPYCKVGGEVSNVVFLGYSNKAHDGYFGNSVIGQWCNIGADSNSSNLKNTYEEVRVWSMDKHTFVRTGTMFFGIVMADHTKCGINTMFNTGSIVGVGCNLFGHGFLRQYLPSFSYGGITGIKRQNVEQVISTAEKVEQRRHIKMCQEEKDILRHIYNNNL